MSERVTVINKKSPYLIVAPHGADDINTDLIAEYTADFLQCSAVINNGFSRKSDIVDVENDYANCNRVDHIKEPVVFDEFLKPILKIKQKNTSTFYPTYPINRNPWTQNKDKKLLIFYIHGVGDNIHKKANDLVGVVVGYGLGAKKDSLTCKQWRKNLFVDKWRVHTSGIGEAFEGKGGGKYAGRSSNNLNQYFRKHEVNRSVETMQLEFPYSYRTSEHDCQRTAFILAQVIMEFENHDHYDKRPNPKFI